MSKKREVLITGGAGFIGSHIQDRFISEGFGVSVVDNLRTGHEKNLNNDTKFYRVDVCDDDAIEAVIAKVKPDTIVHTAAQNQVPASMKDPRLDLEINVRGMFNVLEAARKNRTNKIIYTNTGGALYGEQPDSQLPLSEDRPIIDKPASFYNVSKLAGEYYLKLFGNLYGMMWLSLRLANVYGPRQDSASEAGIIAIFINKMLSGETPVINGDGLHTRDYVYVKDVVRAVMLGMNLKSSDYANISSGVEVTNIEVFQAISNAMGSHFEPQFGPERPGDVRRNVLDNSKAAAVLGWHPLTDFMSGVKETVVYQRDHLSSGK